MKNKDLDAMLVKYKKQIPVNQDLKKDLRKSFAKHSHYGLNRYSLLKKAGLVAAIAAVFCAALIYPGLNRLPKVSAAELKVNDYISLMNVGDDQSLSIGEYSGVVYLPVPGEGIYAYDQGGCHRVSDMEADSVRVSPDGEKLVLSAGGSIYILDHKTGALTELLKGNDNSGIYYEEPNWSPDGKKIIYVKKVIEFRETHGFDVKESGIYEITTAAPNPVKLADGLSPSYVKGTDYILFEDQQNVVLKDLEKGSTKTVDSGRFPSVSPDGSLVAYVKMETAGRELAENAKVEETFGNIWIADTADTEIKKKVTSNTPYYFVDEEEWLKDLEPSEIPQVLSYSGIYDYYNPVWSSESRSVFALRNAVGEGQPSGMKLIRISLGQSTSNPEETVEKYQQALIRRDEDYAKSLLNFKAETPLTVSNPHVSGYRILTSNKENGKTYVDAEMYLEYTANPYYQIIKSRYELSKSEDGYKIDKIAETGSIEVSEQEGVLYLGGSGQQKELLKLQDIPGEYIGSSYSYRLSSLIYLEGSNKLVMAIHQMNEDGRSISVTLLSYDVNKASFELIDKIDAEKDTVGVSGMSADPENRYLSVDIEWNDGDGPDGSVHVYNLKDKSKAALDTMLKDSEIDSVNSLYWSDEGLVFEVLKNGHTVSFLYQPDNGASVQTMITGSLAESVHAKGNEQKASAGTEQGKVDGKDNNSDAKGNAGSYKDSQDSTESGNAGNSNVGKGNPGKESKDTGKDVSTDLYELMIPETWEIGEYQGDFVQLLSDNKVIGSIELLKYYPDQPESQLVPNHSELIDSEALKDFSAQFSKVVKMKLKGTGTAADGSSSEQLHLFFIDEDKNEAYDLSFSLDYVNEETAIQIGESLKIK